MKSIVGTFKNYVLVIPVIALAFFFLTTASCAANRDESTEFASAASWGAKRLVAASRESAVAAMKEQNKSRSKELAEQGMEHGERCLMTAPEEPGCFYWRAVNTGLYYKVHIIGYQRGVKKMIEDCNRVISLDASYDHAGSYRMLGQIYTMLPQTGGSADSATRDLALAEKYLKEAVRLAPDYPENHIALAETLLALDRVDESSKSLENALLLTPHWQRDASYNEWKNSIASLEKRLNKSLK